MAEKLHILNGFSKLSPDERIGQIASFFEDGNIVQGELQSYFYSDASLKSRFLDFSENTISSYHLPYGVAPNFVVDGEVLHVPMVTEESSVVAAAAYAAKFWMDKGGFKTINVSTVKVGQVHFSSLMDEVRLIHLVAEKEALLRSSVASFTSRMEARGGGILSFRIQPIGGIDNQYQLLVEFETVDSMGANFINTCLEELAVTFKKVVEDSGFDCSILMAILSNYTPNSIVRVGVAAPISSFKIITDGMDASTFAARFKLAVDVAKSDTYRAVTHNKGIMNGVDSVVIATGNDFRAVEAAAHAYACRKGGYSGLSSCDTSDGIFSFELEIPLALGVVGGLTSLHPLAKRSLELLGNPSATKLMSISASVGLASNFAAVRSLVTSGIQQGHMRLHLNNILKSFDATPKEAANAALWFANRKVSVNAVKEFLDGQRR